MIRAAKSVAILLIVALSLLGAVGCGGKKDEAERDSDEAADEQQQTEAGPFDPISEETLSEGRARHGNLSTEEYEVEKLDLNDDDETDQWIYKTDEGTVRIERDMNFDGSVDMWQHLDEEGDVVEEELDLDRNENVDVVAYYKDDTVRKKVVSVDFDEGFSIVKIYDKDGQLLRVERDEDGDGTPNVWEYYDDDGERERIGWDRTGDGKPDEFDNLD
ncbi:MAG: hypothetical protein ACOCV2_08970 [Persicimonas sp.]